MHFQKCIKGFDANIQKRNFRTLWPTVWRLCSCTSVKKNLLLWAWALSNWAKILKKWNLGKKPHWCFSLKNSRFFDFFFKCSIADHIDWNVELKKKNLKKCWFFRLFDNPYLSWFKLRYFSVYSSHYIFIFFLHIKLLWISFFKLVAYKYVWTEENFWEDFFKLFF